MRTRWWTRSWTLITLFLTTSMVVLTFGIGHAQTPTAPTIVQDTELSPPTLSEGTVLDEGFLSGGTVSGGFRYQVGNSLVVDGSYFRSLITLDPLDVYSVTTVKGEVYDITALEVGLGAMTGFGFSYIGDDGVAFGAEARLWAVYTYGASPSLQPELAAFFTVPVEYILGP